MVRRSPIAGRGKTAGGIRYQVKKTLLGYSVKYRCPKCQASFTASLNDAGKREMCECGHHYIVPGGEEKAKLEEQRAAKQRETAEQKKSPEDKTHDQEMPLDPFLETSPPTEPNPIPAPPPEPSTPFVPPPSAPVPPIASEPAVAPAPVAAPAFVPEVKTSRTYKRNEYPALTIVRVVLLMIAGLAVVQWMVVSVFTVAAAINASAANEQSVDLPAELIGRSRFDEDLTETQRELIAEHESRAMQTAVRGGAVMFGLIGWTVNTFATAVFVCLIVAFSELIKLLIDIQANTQHTAANA